MDSRSDPPAAPGRRGAESAPEGARVQVDLAARVAHVTRLGELGVRLESMVDIKPVLDDVLGLVVDLLHADRGVVGLWDAESEQVVISSMRGFEPDYAEALERVRPGEGVGGAVISTGRPVVITDALTDPRFAGWRDVAARAGYRSLFGVPLTTAADELMGFVALYFDQPHTPGEAEVELAAGYARQAAGFVERARLYGEARLLATRERRRASQLRQLADAALELTAAATLDQLLRIVTEAAREIIDAHQAVASRLYDGSWASAVTHVSLSEKYAAWRDYDRVPEGLGVLNYVTRENKPLRLGPEELHAHPEWRGLRDAPDHPPLPTYLAAPLIARDGTNLGLIQVSDRVDDQPFSREDEAVLVQLAQMASAVIENTELIDRERQARGEAEEQARLRGRLSDIGGLLAATLDVGEIGEIVARALVPDVADWCGIEVHDDQGGQVLASRAHAAELDAVMQRFAVGRPHRSGRREGPFALVASTTLHRRGDASGTVGELLRAVEGQALLAVPLVRRGQRLGVLSLLRTRETTFDASETAFVEDVAMRATLALETATRYAAERDIAATLQRSLLPHALPVTPGIEVASRYLAGAAGTEVGGDWYDVIDVGNGRVGFVVGDVMGRGVKAATVMGELRAAVRAYALEGHEPAQLLSRLDVVVQAVGDSQLTTCVYGIIDPRTHELVIGTAGHLPPLVVESGVARYLDLEPGLPLGVGGSAFHQSRLRLSPGATVLLYTDGLVEGPESPISEGMAVLQGAAADLAQAPITPDELCDRALKALSRDDDHDDDTALLAITLTSGAPGAPSAPIELTLAPEPGSSALARTFVAKALTERGLTRHLEVTTLLVSELVTNALRHARTELRVRLVTDEHRIRVEVIDGSGQVPQPRNAVPDQDESGRGMLLVDAMADRWGWEPGFGGKYVWFELDVAR